MAPPVRCNEAAATNNKRRASRTSARQFELMLDYVERHPFMVSTRFPASLSARERHWQRLAERLNSEELNPPKGMDRWKKTWFDWKCNVRSKARSASGKKSLSPLEERLIAITGLLDSDDAPLARKDALPYPEVVYEVEDSSVAAYVAGAASRTEASDSAEPVSDLVQSGYGESHGEYIVPTSETSTSGSATVVQARPASTASAGGPPLVLSDVRSLASGPHTAVSVKMEVVDADDVDEEDDSDSDSEIDANESQQAPTTAAEDRSPQFCWTQREDRPPGRPSDVAGHSTPPGRSGRKRPSADGGDALGAASTEGLKARFEFQIFSATKRKLEADERRADAEAEFYRQEVKRSMTLASLHVEERRKIAAVADFHAEERRKAAAKVEMLLEHKKFYIEQQKTEVLKRRLLQLEIKRLKRDLGDTGGAE
ncbi:uncharacterized protein LOC142585765 isoform X1 [Dermacentor variabilis]|uniref:uncharacterized protein LOC142585765 isoform X1 n=1 Tax=Dermacentor variabilis TaxID=34621 RepID=UPI003F5BEEB9